MIQDGEEEEKGMRVELGCLALERGSAASEYGSRADALTCPDVGNCACWRVNTVVCWCSGVLVCWHVGTLVRWRVGALALWRFGALVCRHMPRWHVSVELVQWRIRFVLGVNILLF
jgi:hypothetical protein